MLDITAMADGLFEAAQTGGGLQRRGVAQAEESFGRGAGIVDAGARPDAGLPGGGEGLRSGGSDDDRCEQQCCDVASMSHPARVAGGAIDCQIVI